MSTNFRPHWAAGFYGARRLAVSMALAAYLAAAPALAEDAPVSYPNISGELSLEVENDFTFDSQDPAAELNDLFGTVGLGATLQFTEAFSLNVAILSEPVFDPIGDREFEDQGVFVEELYLRYDAGVVAVFMGKFHPNFGTAWDITPGLYGADFAEDYELAELIGGGVEVPFNAGGAEHVFTLNAFFTDTSFLSESAGQNRGRTKKNSGGATNTEDPSSFSATFDGGLPGTALNYHLGARYLSGGTGDPKDDKGFVGGLNGEWDMGNDASLSAMGEVAYFSNQDAGLGDGIYATIGGSYAWSAWTASASTTIREIEDGFAPDHLAQASVGYAFDFGLGVEVGYKFAQEAEIDSHTLGALVSYAIEF